MYILIFFFYLGVKYDLHPFNHTPSLQNDWQVDNRLWFARFLIATKACVAPLALVLLCPEHAAVTETSVLSQDTYFLDIQCVWDDGATKLSKIDAYSRKSSYIFMFISSLCTVGWQFLFCVLWFFTLDLYVPWCSFPVSKSEKSTHAVAIFFHLQTFFTMFKHIIVIIYLLRLWTSA